MKRLHVMMILVILVFVSIFLGSMFDGGRGAHAGAAVGAIIAGILQWQIIAPAEYRRQLDIIARQGSTLTNPDEFRTRFMKGARLPAVVLVVLGFAALVYILTRQY